MELHTIGIDLGKTVFHLVGVPSNQAGVSEATCGSMKRRVSSVGPEASVDDGKDVVDDRAVVEKERPIRGEVVEYLGSFEFSEYLGLGHRLAFQDHPVSRSGFRLRVENSHNCGASNGRT